MSIRTLAAVAFTLVAAAALAPRAHAFPSGVCPSVGIDTDCDTGITLNPDGIATIQNGLNNGPYDGDDDTLVGIVNSSGQTVSQIGLSGNNIFGLDGDGICTFMSCGYSNPTGYEGPTSSFQVTDANAGFVLFNPGLANGANTYFSLENTLSSANFQVTSIGGNPPSGTPGPAALFLLGVGLAGLAVMRRRTSV